MQQKSKDWGERRKKHRKAVLYPLRKRKMKNGKMPSRVNLTQRRRAHNNGRGTSRSGSIEPKQGKESNRQGEREKAAEKFDDKEGESFMYSMAIFQFGRVRKTGHSIEGPPNREK